MAIADLCAEFPRSSTGMITIPAVPPQGQCDGLQLNSFHVAASGADIPIIPVNVVSPHLAFGPIAAIRVEPHVIRFTSQNKSPVEINGTLNRVGFWITGLSNTGAGADATPADFDWELRAVVGMCTPEVIAHGTTKGLTFNTTRGLLVQASGVLATQWELWARISDVTAHTLRLSLDVVADRFNGQRFEIIKGAITT